jgi:ADP-heptose:LPS heptosyltransferase
MTAETASAAASRAARAACPPASPAETPERVLVIKLGALGNMVLSLGPFAAIRRHHRQAAITLLTTTPYAGWLAGSPYFDRLWADGRPEWWDARGWLRLRRQLLAGTFDRVYDLQTSARSSRYFQLLPRSARPQWSGIAPGCSHPDRDPARNRLHDIERQAGQLRQAGIAEVPNADLSWSSGDIARFALPASFVLLVPGSSAHRLTKRWPARHYGALAKSLARRGLAPVVLGSAAERRLAGEIAEHAPVLDLTGRTDFGQLVSLARAAKLAVGNDTGPMHLIAAAGCPSLVLFSRASDPALCAPRGRRVAVLHRPNLAVLAVDEVVSASARLLMPPAAAS